MYSIAAVDHAVTVLLAVAERPGCGVSDLARHLGGSKQRVFRMLRTLEARGLLQRSADGREYRLGPTAVVLGGAAQDQDDLFRHAAPLLRELAGKSSETAQLRIRDGDESICIAKHEPDRMVRVSSLVGRRRPLHAGSSKVILAFLPESEREAIISRACTALTERTILDPALLREKLADIRRNGFGVSHGEVNADLVSVCAPVFNARGEIHAVVNISAPAGRVLPEDEAGLAQIVMESAGSLSRLLGFRSPARPAQAGR